jgi:hypothetical protein
LVEGDVGGKSAALSGTSKLYFKDFGNVELTDEKIQQTVMVKRRRKNSY